jgi:sulfate adenylyltransferase
LLPEFTGVSDPYEEPDDADLRVDTTLLDRAEALAVVTRHLIDGGWLSGTAS